MSFVLVGDPVVGSPHRGHQDRMGHRYSPSGLDPTKMPARDVQRNTRLLLTS